MLPITQHRVFHIPHSLATIAAIAAVITALNWNRVDESETTGDLQTAKDTASFSAGQAEIEGSETEDSQAARKAADVACRHCGGTGLSGLLPLVLPGASTR